MSKLLELADKAEEWGTALLREAMNCDPRSYGYAFKADRAALAKPFFDCAAALRARAILEGEEQ